MEKYYVINAIITPNTNNMIIRMCMLQRSDKFSLLIVGYENLYNTLRELVDADDDKTKDTKDKQAIFKETISHTNQLEKLRFEVLNKEHILISATINH